MWIEKDVAWVVLWVCVIFLGPFTYRFVRVFFRFVFNRYISTEDIIVVFREDGSVVSRTRMSIYSDGRVVETNLKVIG